MKRPAGSGSDAPFANVSFTTCWYDSPVQTMPSCDQTGVPIHFHSSTTSGSTCRISFRTLARTSPRQSPRSAMRFEMRADADADADPLRLPIDAFMSTGLLSDAVRQSIVIATSFPGRRVTPSPHRMNGPSYRHSVSRFSIDAGLPVQPSADRHRFCFRDDERAARHRRHPGRGSRKNARRMLGLEVCAPRTAGFEQRRSEI